MAAQEFFESKYPLHTRLKKEWCIELMEEYARLKTKELEVEVEELKKQLKARGLIIENLATIQSIKNEKDNRENE